MGFVCAAPPPLQTPLRSSNSRRDDRSHELHHDGKYNRTQVTVTLNYQSPVQECAGGRGEWEWLGWPNSPHLPPPSATPTSTQLALSTAPLTSSLLHFLTHSHSGTCSIQSDLLIIPWSVCGVSQSESGNGLQFQWRVSSCARLVASSIHGSRDHSLACLYYQETILSAFCMLGIVF